MNKVRRDVAPGSVPRSLYVPAAVGALFLVLPLVALVGKADWSAMPGAISSPEARQALELSLWCGLGATTLCVVVGIPLALVLARGEGLFVRILRALVTTPLVLPPMVGGIALLYLLGRHGWIGGRIYVWFNYQIPFTTAAVVLAEAFVALPFLVLSLEGALRTAGSRFETVAATLGAGRFTVFRRITLPLVGPGLLSSSILCFARALGEFGATALFAGDRPGITQTMPLAIYEAYNGSGLDQNVGLALALLLVLVAIVILLLVRPWRPGSV